MKFEISEKMLVPIKSVHSNDGQVEGLPKNPRYIKNAKFKKLVNSIAEFPEMLEIRPIIVNEEMIVLGGNMRLKACKELNVQEVYIQVVKNLSIEKQKEFIIKDNVSFGSWDLDELFTEDWGEDILEHWGFDELVKDDKELSAEEIESKYDDSNCVYPIIPVYDEKHNAFIIIVESETEEAAIRTKFNFPQKAQSYKNSFLGKSFILNAKDILN
jgi:hypothetical protein